MRKNTYNIYGMNIKIKLLYRLLNLKNIGNKFHYKNVIKKIILFDQMYYYLITIICPILH